MERENTMRTLLAFLILAVSAVTAVAQDTAPIPTQIIVGKKVFISNASGESPVPPGKGDLIYKQFYSSMKSWGRYELVFVPADADLVFEVRYEMSFGPVFALGETFTKEPQIRLSILDPKTHIILWAFTEPIQVRRKFTELQNFQATVDKLTTNIKTLAAAAQK
jgi:hypothetical protein